MIVGVQTPKALAQLRSRDSLRALRVLTSPGFPQGPAGSTGRL